MRGAGSDVFAVWGYVISHVKSDSLVELNPEIIAFLIGMPQDRVQTAMGFLTAPDAKSRNKEHEGQRLVQRGEFEYYVPSAAYYRGVRSSDDLREYNRVKQRESRARRNGQVAQRSGEGPLMDECQNWLADVVKNGADYTEKEMRGAWLALNAGGWMWGKNPITDWRSALERQIQTDRSKSYGSKTNRGSGGKRTNLTEGTRNEGNAHKYRNAAVKGVANVQGPATGNDAEGGAGVPGGTVPKDR